MHIIHVSMPKLFGRVRGESQDLLGFGAKRNLDSCGNAVPMYDLRVYFFSDRFGRAGSSKDAAREALVLSNQTQEQVFGFDRTAAVLTGLISSEEYRSARSFSISFKHGSNPPASPNDYPLIVVDARRIVLGPDRVIGNLKPTGQ